MDYKESDMYKTDEELKAEKKERAYGIAYKIREILYGTALFVALALMIYFFLIKQ